MRFQAHKQFVQDVRAFAHHKIHRIKDQSVDPVKIRQTEDSGCAVKSAMFFLRMSISFVLVYLIKLMGEQV